MTEEAQAQENQREFGLQRIYIKDVSFETPNSPMVFQLNWEPESKLDVNSATRALGDDHYEVTLSITLTTKVNDKTAYLVEIQQAGIFMVRGFGEQEMGQMMGAYCPNILFPYAREAISDLITKGSFPQMLLTPVNFDALYAQHLQEQAKKQQPTEAAPETAH